MSTTTDPRDPRLRHGTDDGPVPQNEAYLVLSEVERVAGFVRPLRSRYIHDTCGVVTTMSQEIAKTYARNPRLYGATYCTACRRHLPVHEFVWSDGSGQRVGS